MTDQEYVDKIRETYPSLDAWRDRASKSPPEQPQTGSDLALDDKTFAHHRISELVRHSLISSGEHLRLARDAIEMRYLYPSAHFTTMRGAIVGAAQAVWILSPDDGDTRVQRGLRGLSTMYGELEKYLRIQEHMTLDAGQQVALGEQLDWVALRRSQVMALRKTKDSMNQTDMIEDALACTFADQSKRDEGMLLWRQMGADAHALGWSLLLRRHLVEPDPKSGLAVVSVKGNASQIAQPFFCGFGLLKHGWSLFDQRCEAA